MKLFLMLLLGIFIGGIFDLIFKIVRDIKWDKIAKKYFDELENRMDYCIPENEDTENGTGS